MNLCEYKLLTKQYQIIIFKIYSYIIKTNQKNKSVAITRPDQSLQPFTSMTDFFSFYTNLLLIMNFCVPASGALHFNDNTNVITVFARKIIIIIVSAFNCPLLHHKPLP